MRKKISILLAFAMMLMMLTGCNLKVNSGEQNGGEENTELNAAYQMIDVSDYLGAYDVVDATKSPQIALEEDDERIAKAYTYQEIAAFFTVQKKSADEMKQYFDIYEEKNEDGMTYVQLMMARDYYLANPLDMEYSANGVTYTLKFDPIENYSGNITGYNPNDAEDPMKDIAGIALSKVTFTGNDCLYQFNAPDATDTFYVVSESENSFGKFTLIEEYEDSKFDITYLLHMLKEKGYIKADGTIQPPVTEKPGTDTNTPESEQPESESQKPENSEQPQEPETQTWSKPFMGKYFIDVRWENGEIVGYENYGIYFDEEYIYYKVGNYEIHKKALSECQVNDYGNGHYSIMEDDRNGFFYSAEEDALGMINAGYDMGLGLYPADKEAFDKIGTY